MNSPQLLMLSGIGPSDHLRDVGVDCNVNLPGVGENLQDHLEVSSDPHHQKIWGSKDIYLLFCCLLNQLKFDVNLTEKMSELIDTFSILI